jgi:Fe-S cluster assembly iron-binding protein IscA
VATIEEPTTLIALTERAAAKIKELQAEPGGDAEVLRIARGGGCLASSTRRLRPRRQEGDHELGRSASGGRRSVQRPYLQGAQIDFLDGSRSPASRSRTRMSRPPAAAATLPGRRRHAGLERRRLRLRLFALTRKRVSGGCSH